MSFPDAIRTCLKQYVTFTGRARRSEYWFFILFAVITFIVVSIVDQAIGTYPLLYIVAVLGLFLPILAAQIRRLHDTGKSGFFVLLSLIPLVGGIIVIVLCCLDSTPDNKYGPNPKGFAGYAPGTPPPPPGAYGGYTG